MKILWLASWYPSQVEPFNGDFVQRHAQAASLHHDIEVLHVIKDEKGIITKGVLLEKNKNGRLTEKIIYHHSVVTPVSFLNKILGANNYKKLFQQYVKAYINQKGKPDLVHVHVPWKAGLIALWIKRKYGIPFVVTEHWGIYNKIVEDNIHTKSFLFRLLLKKIFKEAKAFVTPSRFLGGAVNTALLKKNYVVIPNVVNTSFFHLGKEKAPRFTFLHVSNMVPLKNVEGILDAFELFLNQTGADACLVLVGNKEDRYVRLAKAKNLLGSSVFFKGEITYPEVAKEMQKAHVLVLNSNIENSPCVIGEALCCGLPVIATNVGGIPELLDKDNGLLVPPFGKGHLAEAMVNVYGQSENFHNEEISKKADEVFSMKKIGEMFDQLYRGLL